MSLLEAPAPADAPAIPTGTSEATWQLHLTYRRTRDPAALDELVRTYLPYATRLARRWRRGCHATEDLCQVASEALVHALVRFDPDRELPFYAFAGPTIVGSLKRYYRNQGWMVSVPRSVHDLTVRGRDAEEVLTSRLHRCPTDAEVAAEIGALPDQVRRAHAADRARTTVSVDVVGEDAVGGQDHGVGGAFADAVADRIDLRRALELLAPGDRVLLHRYFVANETQAQIAADLGVSQMHVSRILSSILRRLRTHLAAT